MRILLTNDDGISSPGITLLAKALRDLGHKVFIVAPDSNRSGYSHSICFLNEPIKLVKIEDDTWSCSGTPVDCVIIALLGGIGEINELNDDDDLLNRSYPIDLLLSGINTGANLGTDIVYSGTAGAARQGSIFGIPSVALSLVENHGEWNWEPVISYIAENLAEIANFWKKGAFVNVNFPNKGKKPSALIPTFPSIRYYNDRIVSFAAPDGDVYCFARAGRGNNVPQEGSDWSEVKKNNAALSLIQVEPAEYLG